MVFSGYNHLVVGLLSQWYFYFQLFSGTSTLFSIVAVSIYMSTSSERGFPFSQVNPLQYLLFVNFWMLAV